MATAAQAHADPVSQPVQPVSKAPRTEAQTTEAAGAEQVKSSTIQPFSVIFAADEQGGIGKGGALPWKLPGDMKYFKDVTMKPSSKSVPESKRNVCIMGRLTWESIPLKFRPLDGRINFVLSKTLTEEDARKGIPEEKHDLVHVASEGLAACLQRLTEEEFIDRVDKVFLIGGAKLIQEALQAPLRNHLNTVYVTRVNGDHSCDVKVEFPEGETVMGYRRTNQGDLQKEEKASAEYRFETYMRMNREEQQYLDMVQDIIETGNRKGDRTGTGTLSKFGAQMRFSLRDGKFPLLTSKRVFWRGVAEELLWFIRGCTDGRALKEKGVNIWDGNGTREFLDGRGLQSRAVDDLGPIYGFQWRHFGAEYTDRDGDYTGKGVDQLAEVIETIKKNPNDRRIIMSAWNPCALKEMALPPCHVMCQFYVANGELSCQMYQRSCDMGLGVPFNIASYALLTCLIADVTGLRPGDFIHTLGDAHVYTNHVDPLKEQLTRNPRPFPTLKIRRHHERIEDYTMEDLAILDYTPLATIKMQMAV